MRGLEQTFGNDAALYKKEHALNSEPHRLLLPLQMRPLQVLEKVAFFPVTLALSDSLKRIEVH